MLEQNTPEVQAIVDKAHGILMKECPEFLFIMRLADWDRRALQESYNEYVLAMRALVIKFGGPLEVSIEDMSQATKSKDRVHLQWNTNPALTVKLRPSLRDPDGKQGSYRGRGTMPEGW